MGLILFINYNILKKIIKTEGDADYTHGYGIIASGPLSTVLSPIPLHLKYTT